MSDLISQIQNFFTGPLGNFLLALGILIIGYLVARIVANIVRRLLKRVEIDNRLANALAGEQEHPEYEVEDIIGKTVFWILMLFVIVGFLQQLGLTRVAGPIDALLQQITTVYLPSLIGAGLLLFIAWIVATILRFLVIKGSDLLKIDERLTKHAALEEGEQVSISKALGTAVYWFVFLLFLPAVLNSLGIDEIADPVQSVFDTILGYIPSIFAAGVTFAIGYVVARIVRQIVTNLLAAVGTDGVGQRLGLSAEQSLSRIIGTIVYTFILLFVLIAALEQLNIAAISDPTTQMLTTIFDAVPGIIGAALVLLVSYYLGRFVGNLVADLLKNFGFNALPEKLGFNWQGERTVSELAGYLTTLVIILFAASSAAELLGSAFLVDTLSALIAFLWQVLLAGVILAIGLWLANIAHQTVLSAAGDNAGLMANLARVAIIIFAAAMALRQLGVANEIVNMAFGFLLAAIAFAVALAFGLGSREIAGREVDAFLGKLRSGSEAEAEAEADES